MPIRMLRDWTQSDKVDSICWQAEIFFIRLIMKVDDYGCFYADTRLLKANLFPLKLDKVREADILRWLAECQKAGLIVLYFHDKKKYLQIIDFKQRLDKAKAKFPLPNDSMEVVNDFPAETEIETEIEKETETEAAAPGVGKKILENPFSKNFLDQWAIWKEYKKKEFRFFFKSIESEQAAINELVNLSAGNEEKAVAIIHQSMAKGWKGFFELKNGLNGKTTKPGIDDYAEAHARRYAERK